MTIAPAGFRGRFLLEDPERAPYAEAAGILSATPRAVAVPEDAEDVCRLVRWAAATATPLIPRGAGTGMPGGNVGDGVAVDLVAGFQAVGEAADARISVEPGVTLARLNAAAHARRLHFPVDPSSGERCTLGGMIANNSAGAHSVRYGATREWVESANVVLASGQLVRLERGTPPNVAEAADLAKRVLMRMQPEREAILTSWPRVRKNSSGYALREFLLSGDLLDLLIGSEGTLGVVVSATVRLAPILPHRGALLLEFDDLDAVGAVVPAIVSAGPSTCEMLDRTFLDLIRGSPSEAAYPLRAGLEAVLIVEAEAASPGELQEELRRITRAAANGASRIVTARSTAEMERLWALRHAASPLIAAHAGSRISMQFIEDGVVPIEKISEYVALLRSTLGRHRLPAVIFGHAGDGNLHVNPLVDVTEPRWREVLEEVLIEIAGGIAALGGTLAGEHGDGRLRAPLLETVWGAEMVERFRFVKMTFDPDGILNPGVILPLPGQRPFDALRSYP